MTLEKLSLTLNPSTDNYEYQLYPIDNVSVTSRKEAFSIAPPGLAASENILLGISGMQADISIRGYAWDNGEDRANGSYSETVVTVQEQLNYLEDVIHSPEFAASWQLDHLTGSAFNDDEVFVENIEMDKLSQQNPKWKKIRIRLRRGQSIG